MPKALCIFAMVVSGLVLLLFMGDFVLNLLGMKALAPFYGVRPWLDIVFSLGAGALGFMSWLTFKEQV